MQELPEQLRRSLTWDRGHEMADHKRFTVDTLGYLTPLRALSDALP